MYKSEIEFREIPKGDQKYKKEIEIIIKKRKVSNEEKEFQQLLKRLLKELKLELEYIINS